MTPGAVQAVLAYADAIDELRDEFMDLLISEQGKPVCHSPTESNAIN
jgi:acyl-CoA reductase-like NAD-dependent aldehyde dehydrogenase